MHDMQTDYARWRAAQHHPNATAWMVWLGALGLGGASPAGRASRPAFDAWLASMNDNEGWTEFDAWCAALHWRAAYPNYST